VEGDPVAEILRFADEGRYDVIVIGTCGRRVHESGLGSVAQEVALAAACPVVVVHARAARRPTLNPTGSAHALLDER
jgi:nucleotide-binding universal stress UspA family protein